MGFQLSIYQAEVELSLESDGAAFPPRIIAMSAGYLHKAKLGSHKYQNIVVLTSDWTVYCLTSSLKVKWSKKVAATPPDDVMIRCVCVGVVWGEAAVCVYMLSQPATAVTQGALHLGVSPPNSSW